MRLERNHGDVPNEGIATQQRDDLLPPVNDGQFAGYPLSEGESVLGRCRAQHMISIGSQKTVQHFCNLFIIGHQEDQGALMTHSVRRILHAPMMTEEGCGGVSHLLHARKSVGSIA